MVRPVRVGVRTVQAVGEGLLVFPVGRRSPTGSSCRRPRRPAPRRSARRRSRSVLRWRSVDLHRRTRRPSRSTIARPKGARSASMQTTASSSPSGLKAGLVVNGHSWLASVSRSGASSLPSTRARRGTPPSAPPCCGQVHHPPAILGDRREGRCRIREDHAGAAGSRVEAEDPRPSSGSSTADQDSVFGRTGPAASTPWRPSSSSGLPGEARRPGRRRDPARPDRLR